MKCAGLSLELKTEWGQRKAINYFFFLKQLSESTGNIREWVIQGSTQRDSQDPFKSSEEEKETTQNHSGS